jgi:hypothetical protein
MKKYIPETKREIETRMIWFDLLFRQFDTVGEASRWIAKRLGMKPRTPEIWRSAWNRHRRPIKYQYYATLVKKAKEVGIIIGHF